MDKTFIKRRYFDMRLGGTQVSPFIQLANFTMLSFLWIKDIIPVEVFGPLFMISGFITLSYIGSRFRKYQATTDTTMMFERQEQLCKALYFILKAIEDSKTIECSTDEIKDELEYLKKISEGKT